MFICTYMTKAIVKQYNSVYIVTFDLNVPNKSY